MSPSKILMVSILLLHAGLQASSQGLSNQTNTQLLQSLTQSAPDTTRLQLLLELGNRSLFRPGEKKEDLDSAWLFYQQAQALSDQLRDPRWINKTQLLIAHYHVESGRLQTGIEIINKIIRYHQQAGDKKAEAQTWSKLGDLLMNNNKHDQVAARINAYEQAIGLYRQTGHMREQYYHEGMKGMTYSQARQYESAEKAFENMRKGTRGIDSLQELYMYSLEWLIVTAFWQTDYYKELYYSLENLENMQRRPDLYPVARQDAGYNHLARVYDRLGMYDKSEYYGRQQLEIVLKLKGDYKFGLSTLVDCLLKQGKTQDAINVLEKTTKQSPPTPAQLVTVNQLYGQIAERSGDYAKAEGHFLQALKILDTLNKKLVSPSVGVGISFSLGGLYVATHRYKEAAPYVTRIEQAGTVLTLQNQAALAQLKSAVDSAAGLHLAALQSFQRHKWLSDSMLNVAKSQQINLLEISFQTKEKQNRIDLLNAQNTLREQQLSRTKQQRNLTIAGILLLMVITGLVYYAFRNKAKNNRLLKEQQGKINEQNEFLQELLSEKESLLADKDMLLKEVHHRVKNNLQIVMNILASQTAELKSKNPAEVMEESQQRVQTIALIHEKLYIDDGGANIFMPSYINDLTTELDQSLNAAYRHIRFVIETDDITLDIDQAVPVGLILNEAITNAIKHAFDTSGGQITISVRKNGDLRVRLQISDTGKGMPDGYDYLKSNSLGMKMIRGLSKQMGGELHIVSKQGTQLSVIFPCQRMKKKKPWA